MKTGERTIIVVYHQDKKGQSQERLDEAYDILFEEILKMEQKRLLVN